MNDSVDSIQASMLKYMQENRDAFAKKLAEADKLDFHGGVMAGPINNCTSHPQGDSEENK